MEHSELVEVCLDTCHAFAAGYDIRTQQAVEDVVNHIDATVGIDQVKLIHLNDSIGDLNSHRNRHEHIGLGKIGEEEFTNVLHSQLGLLPLILETPQDARRSDLENLRKVQVLATK